jgi:hypothetical protein
MERYRNQDVCAFEHARAVMAHLPCQGGGHRPAAIVFERVQNRPQRPVVRPDGCAGRQRGRPAPAPRTHRRISADDPPGLKRIAAVPAEGRHERHDPGPAACADRSAGGRLVRTTARGARRREEDRDETVG